MRIRIAVVWLLLALLPLRGWATLSMQLPSPAGPSNSSTQHEQAPCHEMATMAQHAQAQFDAAQSPPEDNIASHAGCSMCDLCHAAAACGVPRAPTLALNGVERVRSAPDADTGRALVGGLERPPRILHA